MKLSSIVIGFLIFNFILNFNGSTLQNSQNDSPEFSLGFKEKEVKTYKITSFNEVLASTYLGTPWITDILGSFAYVGAYRFIRVDNISYLTNLTSLNDNQNCTGWKLTISSWNWVTNFDWDRRLGDPDIIYDNLEIFEDAEDRG